MLDICNGSESRSVQYSQVLCRKTGLQLDQKLAAIQSDRGGEFMLAEFNRWLEKRSIVHRVSNVSCSAENGVAERLGAILQTMFKAMLADANLSTIYSAEAVGAACYMANRVWSSSINEIPYHVLYNRDPKLGVLRVFGTKVWVNIFLNQRRKGGARAKQLTFIDYQSGMKAYRFINSQLGLAVQLVLMNAATG